MSTFCPTYIRMYRWIIEPTALCTKTAQPAKSLTIKQNVICLQTMKPETSSQAYSDQEPPAEVTPEGMNGPEGEKNREINRLEVCPPHPPENYNDISVLERIIENIIIECLPETKRNETMRFCKVR